MRHCLEGGYGRFLLRGQLSLAHVRASCGDFAQAASILDDAQRLAEGVGVPRLLARVAAHRARIQLMQSPPALADVERWARSSGLKVEGPLRPDSEFEYLTIARLRIAQANGPSGNIGTSGVMSLLTRLREAAERSGREGSVVEILALSSLAFHAQGHTAKALTLLSRALALAEPQGLVRVFVDEGAPMAALLREARDRGIMPEYVATLLAAFGGPERATAPLRKALAEPLTDREHEVLKLMAAGLSNREIAEELSVTLHTVKAHGRAVFGKLGVRSRAQAAARAREWHLL
jgi:LuxR family maltose regulon positive regulatory protein